MQMNDRNIGSHWHQLLDQQKKNRAVSSIVCLCHASKNKDTHLLILNDAHYFKLICHSDQD